MSTQNVKELLKDAGESSVLVQLYYRLIDTGWNAFKNVSEQGCDIVLLPKLVDSFSINTHSILKIEVKTRQLIQKTKTNWIDFTLTEGEYDNSHFLIGFWFEENEYFIVPTKELTKTKSKDRFVYKYTVSRSQLEDPEHKCQKHRGNWNAIKGAMMNTWNDD